MFKDNVSEDQIKEYAAQVNNGGGEVTQFYGIIPGFAAKITEDQFQQFQSLQGDIIESIEPDQMVTTQSE
ncbi:serine proteinase inhibitor IA-1 [Guyanagaster necrorhizus]|uniref:Serine proteinase inhibitor IA-1 n=1 Tax=Guyanagaster necrorhizus TaxID=856835 RepID=A0A9P8AX42_9AGAR|nr:serine proteinase inhibitor IA-1 [Guyanagaster necrorhizus MCA 3950]KAG7449542.1 serine proteinase inhibitor IA-1 [Guyanagaster necrorhizus MCA 3950]